MELEPGSDRPIGAAKQTESDATPPPPEQLAETDLVVQADLSDLGGGREAGLDNRTQTDPYQTAEAAFAAKIAQLQQAGRLRKLTEIATEEDLDDHFDQLTALYRQTCLEMGLDWPPPFREDED